MAATDVHYCCGVDDGLGYDSCRMTVFAEIVITLHTLLNFLPFHAFNMSCGIKN